MISGSPYGALPSYRQITSFPFDRFGSSAGSYIAYQFLLLGSSTGGGHSGTGDGARGVGCVLSTLVSAELVRARRGEKLRQKKIAEKIGGGAQELTSVVSEES